MLRYTIDRARPGLVALYDIRPGNGAGQFLQPPKPARGASLKDKVTIAQEETIPNIWNGTMFGDVD